MYACFKIVCCSQILFQKKCQHKCMRVFLHYKKSIVKTNHHFFFFFLVVSKQKIIIMFTYMLQMLGTVSLHMNHTIIHWSSPHLCGSKWNWHSQYHLHFSDTNLMCLNMSQSNFVTGDRHRRRKKMNNPPTLIMVLLSQPHTHFSGIYHLCRQQPTLLYHMYCHSYLQLESHHAEVSSSN